MALSRPFRPTLLTEHRIQMGFPAITTTLATGGQFLLLCKSVGPSNGAPVSSTSDEPGFWYSPCAHDYAGDQIFCYYFSDISNYNAILPVGTHTIVAFISSSDDPYAAFSTSWTVTVTGVGPVTTSTNIAASTQSPSYGDLVVLTATVTPTGVSVPTGIVNFFDGTTVIGGGLLHSGWPQHVADPNYSPLSDTRFNVQNGVLQYTAAGGVVTSGNLTVTNATSTTNTVSHEYSLGFSLEAKIGFQFIANLGTTLLSSNTTT